MNYPPILKVFRKEEDGVDRKIKTARYKKSGQWLTTHQRELFFDRQTLPKLGNERNEKEKKRKTREHNRRRTKKVKFV